MYVQDMCQLLWHISTILFCLEWYPSERLLTRLFYFVMNLIQLSERYVSSIQALFDWPCSGCFLDLSVRTSWVVSICGSKESNN